MKTHKIVGHGRKMEYFTQWSEIPDHLMTKTKLGKAGLKLSPGQKPVGKKTGGYGPYELYDSRDAVAKRKQSKAQKAASLRNIEKARAALTCDDCGVYGKYLRNGRCSHCQEWHEIAQESDQAKDWLQKLANRDDWLILDTETTGLDEDAEIIQIGIVDASGQTLVSQRVRPLGEIDPEATAVHGLDADALANEPLWPEIYPEVARLINGRSVLAYNANFDERMLRQTCTLHGVDIPNSRWNCIMELFAAYAGDWSSYHKSFRWHSLVSAINMMDLRPRPHEDERYKLHDASGDAWLTWRLVKAFANDAT